MRSNRLKNTVFLLEEDADELVHKLNMGKVDAVILDSVSAVWWTSHSSDQLKLAGRKFPIGLGLGIAINKKLEKWLPLINQAIKEVHAEQAFVALHGTYIEHASNS